MKSAGKSCQPVFRRSSDVPVMFDPVMVPVAVTFPPIVALPVAEIAPPNVALPVVVMVANVGFNPAGNEVLTGLMTPTEITDKPESIDPESHETVTVVTDV